MPKSLQKVAKNFGPKWQKNKKIQDFFIYFLFQIYNSEPLAFYTCSRPKTYDNFGAKNIKTFLILILQSDLLFIIQIFDSASKNCNNIKFVAHLVFDSGRETNKELNFIARSLMASCFFTSKWVYRVLTNFSPNPAKLKFRINWIKLDQNGSKWIKMDQINQNESR